METELRLWRERRVGKGRACIRVRVELEELLRAEERDSKEREISRKKEI